MKKHKNESLSTKKFEDYFREGIKKSKNKQWEVAASLFEKSIQIEPTQLTAQYNKGVTMLKLNRFKQAEQIFLRCIEINPEFPQPYLSLGNLYKSQSDYKKAKGFFQKFLNICPGDSRGLYRLGSLQLAEKKLNEAQKIFASLISKDSQNSMYYHKMGVVEWQKGRKQEAQKLWVSSLKLNQQNYESMYRLGILNLQKKNYEQAQKQLSRADNEGNSNIFIPWSRILNWRKSGKLQKSVKRAEELLSNRDKTMKKFNLNDQKFGKIQKKLTELIQISSLEMKKQKMDEKDMSIVDEITQGYDQSTSIQLREMKQITQQLALKIKRLSLKQNECSQQMQKINKKIKQMQNQIKELQELKQQFGWDKDFDNLVDRDPEFSLYYRLLYSNISSTVKSYQLVNTGVINGQNIIKSPFGHFVTKMSKILKLGESIHCICSFCSVLNKLGQLYLQKQKNIVIQDIVFTTSCIYNQRILSKYVAETILYLSKSSQFIQILKNQERDNKPWYQKIIAKLEKQPDKIVERLSQFKNIEMSIENNMVMHHTAQILLNLIKKQNRKQICLSKNPLLRAAEFWVESLKLVIVQINAVMIQINEHFLSTAKAFCRIIYGDQVVETETNKQVLKYPTFSRKMFELKRVKNMRLKFEIYRKQMLLTPYLIASGYSSDEPAQNLIVQLKNENFHIVGKLEINIS